MLNDYLVPWEEAKLVVPVEPMPWPANRDERISVNSFGISGSNVHVSQTVNGDTILFVHLV